MNQIPYVLTVTHTHRHGVSTYTALMGKNARITEELAIKIFDIDFEPDLDEYLDITVDRPDMILSEKDLAEYK